MVQNSMQDIHAIYINSITQDVHCSRIREYSIRTDRTNYGGDRQENNVNYHIALHKDKYDGDFMLWDDFDLAAIQNLNQYQNNLNSQRNYHRDYICPMICGDESAVRAHFLHKALILLNAVAQVLNWPSSWSTAGLIDLQRYRKDRSPKRNQTIPRARLPDIVLGTEDGVVKVVGELKVP